MAAVSSFVFSLEQPSGDFLQPVLKDSSLCHASVNSRGIVFSSRKRDYVIVENQLQFCPAPREVIMCWSVLSPAGRLWVWVLGESSGCSLLECWTSSQSSSVTVAQHHQYENTKPHTSHLLSLASTCPYLACCTFSQRMKLAQFDFCKGEHLQWACMEVTFYCTVRF